MRALTHRVNINKLHKVPCRNEVTAREGIDTQLLVRITLPIPEVEMRYKPERALTRNCAPQNKLFPEIGRNEV